MKLKKFTHKIQNTHRTSMDLGYLYPMSFLDVPMGQTTLLKSSAMLRFQPMLAPVQMDLRCNIVHFYVPYRIIWPDWDDFISMKKQLELPLLKMNYTGTTPVNLPMSKYLLNYIGLPSKLNFRQLNIPCLWFLAYYKIWNEHFVDDEAQADQKMDIEKIFRIYTEGVTSDNIYDLINKIIVPYLFLKRVNWRRDRFVKALLETETDPNISLPVGANGIMNFEAVWRDGEIRGKGKLGTEGFSSGTHDRRSGNVVFDFGSPPTGYASELRYASGLKGVDLKEFILATDLWNFKQNQNLYGTEYEDYLRKYGIRNLDGRLQKSEFIGGFSDRIQISDVIA